MMANKMINENLNADQVALQENLIAALNRLQYSGVSSDYLLADKHAHDFDAVMESFFSFAIGIKNFLVSSSCFCEVMVANTIAALPNAPECLLGLYNVRGVLIPIFQLHTALDAEMPKKLTIFCVGKAEAAIGIVIDALPLSLSLPRREKIPLKESDDPLLNKLVEDSYFSSSKLWHVLDGKKIGSLLFQYATASPVLANSLGAAAQI